MPLRVVLASAGSGKTESLATYALSALQETFGARPTSASQEGVFAITFTRNAAAELRERILQKAHKQNNSELLRQIILGQAPLFTSTIDAFIREVYYRLAPILGLPAYASLIVENQDTAEATHDIIESMLAQLSEPRLLRVLQRVLQARLEEKGRRILLEQLLQEAVEAQLKEGPLRSRIRLALYEWVSRRKTPSSEELPWYQALPLHRSEAALAKWVYQAMQAYRESARKLFLSDMQAVVQLVARNAAFLLSEQTYFSQLFVDEAQDTSPAQWEILNPIFEELQGRGGWITLIGDPKQSIYAWRGADFRQLLRFAEKDDKQNVIFLDTNYRSHDKIVEFNNNLYTQLPALISDSLKKRSGLDTIRRRRLLLGKLQKLYDSQAVCQKAVRSPNFSSPYVEIIHLDAEVEETELQKTLAYILARLRQEGIPPEKTAFLVRKNEQIPILFRLLPTYSLQVQSVELETCTTLAATMALLELTNPQVAPPSPRSVEEFFLLQQPNSLQIYQALSEIKGSFARHPTDHLEKWNAFQKIGDLWLRNYPKHRPFWEVLLSNLYVFLARHPFYGLAEILRWWNSRAKKIVLNLPPTEGVYPVLTIHKAKGLAWDAVIVPFASWELLRASVSVKNSWHRVPESLLPTSLAQTLQGLKELALERTWELPIALSSDTPALDPLYTEAYITGVIENINLHYVATTRPREFLFLIAKEPRGPGYKGLNTWAGFWTQVYKPDGTVSCK